MSDCSHFQELAALLSGGFLSDSERMELCYHTKVCVECLKAEEAFSELVRSGLPLTVSPVEEFFDRLKIRPDSSMRSRFFHRARRDGIVFSPNVESFTRLPGRRIGFLAAAAAAVATALIAMAFYGSYRRPSSQELQQARQQVDQLKQANSALVANLSRLNQSLAEGQREVRSLRAQLADSVKTADILRLSSDQTRSEADRSSSQNAQLLDEARNQEQLLAEARAEAARINQMVAADQTSLVAQQTRITELLDRLRIANATLDMERQYAAEGQDFRKLMLARRLHVIDVRDTDPDGNPTRAFGRVFMTDGKSLSFYAFDLNGDSALDAKRSFQVWAVPEASKNAARSLGFLRLDARAPGRWVLKVENPQLIKEISSVFVTSEPSAGGKQPTGQKMLYAYLSEFNHP